jgi:signal peptidase I
MKYLLILFAVAIAVGCIEEGSQCKNYDFHKIEEKWAQYETELIGVAGCHIDSYVVFEGETSMYPTIKCNDSIYGINTTQYPYTLDKIQKCDIIVFKKPEEQLFAAGHRIIKKDIDKEGIYFITKGDNNLYDDTTWYGKVRKEDIVYIITGAGPQ